MSKSANNEAKNAMLRAKLMQPSVSKLAECYTGVGTFSLGLGAGAVLSGSQDFQVLYMGVLLLALSAGCAYFRLRTAHSLAGVNVSHMS